MRSEVTYVTGNVKLYIRKSVFWHQNVRGLWHPKLTFGGLWLPPAAAPPPSSTTTCMYVMGGGFGHSNLPQGKGGMQQREALEFRSLDVDISAFVPDSHSHYASS